MADQPGKSPRQASQGNVNDHADVWSDADRLCMLPSRDERRLYFGSLVLFMFDHNIHDGFTAAGGLPIGLIVGVVVFRSSEAAVQSGAIAASR
jgi:hypothetical protein